MTAFNYANPTELAYSEARRIWATDRHFRIISVGSGKPNEAIVDVEPHQTQRGWLDSFLKLGQAIWTDQQRELTLRYYSRLLALYSGTERVHYQMKSYYDGNLTGGVACEYRRLNVGALLGDEKFNHWRSLEDIRQLTNDYLEGDGQEIFNICRSMF